MLDATLNAANTSLVLVLQQALSQYLNIDLKYEDLF